MPKKNLRILAVDRIINKTFDQVTTFLALDQKIRSSDSIKWNSIKWPPVFFNCIFKKYNSLIFCYFNVLFDWLKWQMLGKWLFNFVSGKVSNVDTLNYKLFKYICLNNQKFLNCNFSNHCIQTVRIKALSRLHSTKKKT